MVSTPDPCIGEPLFIECIFSAIPVNVTWRKGSDVLNTVDDHYQIMTIPDNSSSLKIFAATNEFNGLYECIISNDAGRDNMSMYIELKSCKFNVAISTRL